MGAVTAFSTQWIVAFRLARQSRVARDSGWMFLAQLVRIATQAGYFVIAARALGPEEFGRLAAALACVAIAVPFAACGSGNLMIRDVVADARQFKPAWGSAILMISVAGPALIALVVLSTGVLLPQFSLRLMVTIGVADLLFVRLADTCAQAFQALHNLRWTAIIFSLPGLFRLAAAFLFVEFGGRTAGVWASWYAASSAAVATVAVIAVVSRLGAPQLDVRRTARNLREGAFYAVGLSSETIYGDIDKTMLARFSTLSSAGIYAAAARAVGLAFVPIYSILQANYSRFFSHGSAGLGGTLRFARRLMPAFTAAGFAAAAALFLAAPVAPSILGPGFAESVDALRWLAFVPLLQAAYYLAGDTLTGAGHQRGRSLVQIGVAAGNVLLNVILIPRWGWRGAAVSTLGCDAALAVALWALVWRLRALEATA